MPNKKIMCLLPAVFALTFLNIFIVFQVSALKKSVSFLEAKVKVFDERLSAFLEQEKEMIENIDKKISLILNEQEENQKEIKNELERIKYRTDTQFSKTVSMSKTYDAILAEQKKKTVDTAEKDSAFIGAKKHAVGLYGKNEFRCAYDEFSRLAKERREDMECLSYKIKSLFYVNRADSSKYKEILSGIRILKDNAAADSECLEIEKAVLVELGGADE